MCAPGPLDGGAPPTTPSEIERLRAELAEARLRARERELTAQLCRRELAAMEGDLRALDRHVGHLEHGRLVLEIELGQLRDRAAELFADLERDEAVVAAQRRELEALQQELASCRAELGRRGAAAGGRRR